MHPEVLREEPGPCPLCGMALEPSAPSADEAENHELADMRHRFWLCTAATTPIFWAMLGEWFPAIDPVNLFGAAKVAWGQLLLATAVVVWGGRPFFERAWQSIVNASPNMFTLIALGTGSAWVYSIVATIAPGVLPESFLRSDGYAPLYFEAAAVIVTLVLLGQVLELRARSQTSDAIRALLRLAPKLAHRIDADGHETDVSLDAVALGDQLRVRPGENIPVDGEVLEGSSYIDESMLTGEPAPVSRKPGEQLTAGTTNGSGAIVMRADHVGSETLLAQIVSMVAQAQRSRAPVQRLVDAVAAWFVPAVVLSAIVAGIVWAILGPEPRFAFALLVAVSVLIVACPCALGLATPMSIMVGVGRGAQAGVLIKDAQAIEQLENVTTLVIDKTGTLTEGRPSLQRIIPSGQFRDSDVLRLAAAVESLSEHPLGRAIVNAATLRNLALPAVSNFTSDPGLGVWGTVNNRSVLVGNRALMQQRGINPGELADDAARERRSGATAVLVAIDGRIAGVLVIEDAIKRSTPSAIKALRQEGIRVVMLTGDDQYTAEAVADQLGLDEFNADIRPEDKANIVSSLQRAGNVVAMAGDGVNDAPALAQADVGIAMGTGTDIAMEAAGITLVSGDLTGIVRAIRLSHLTMRNIRQNLLFAFGYNALGVPIAAGVLYPVFGLLLSPMIASIAMSLSSVSVIANALRLRTVSL